MELGAIGSSIFKFFWLLCAFSSGIALGDCILTVVVRGDTAATASLLTVRALRAAASVAVPSEVLRADWAEALDTATFSAHAERL